ncbi:MAG: hypothetical protein L3J71_10110 [Victivallaceae bacterium]|nr:hypothetical protein [Victivallaceae bacterium]
MNELLLLSMSCVVLGCLISIHPCPLTTNLAAITMLSSWQERKYSLLLGIFFIVGYSGAFISLGILLSFSGLKIYIISNFLQNTLRLFIGLIIILVGMLHLKLINFDTHGNKIIKWTQNIKWNAVRALLMGFMLALSFCPVTATLFFGLLFPLAVQYEQIVLFPLLFGIGAALPLVILALLLRKSSNALSVSKGWQNHMHQLTGWVMILLGIYISIQEIYLR